MRKSLLIVASAALLSGCGGQPAAPANEAAPANPAASAAAASGYNAEDACATLPKEKVAAITGLQVSAATLQRVTKGTADTAGFSTCTYSIAGGGTLDFFARQSPVDDNTPEAIARTKAGMVENMGAKTADIPGLGTAAFSAEPMSQLHVFAGTNRYFFFMWMNPPAGKALEHEQALAKAVIG